MFFNFISLSKVSQIQISLLFSWFPVVWVVQDLLTELKNLWNWAALITVFDNEKAEKTKVEQSWTVLKWQWFENGHKIYLHLNDRTALCLNPDHFKFSPSFFFSFQVQERTHFIVKTFNYAVSNAWLLVLSLKLLFLFSLPISHCQQE